MAAGGSATIFQCVLLFLDPALLSSKLSFYRIAETLPAEVLTALHAPAKPDYPVLGPKDLVNYDAYIFGVPTRYGSFPAQWKVIPDLLPRLLDKITEAES